MSINFPILLASALIPLIVGFIWYNPKTFGNSWMKAAKVNESELQGSNMMVIFGLTYFLSFLAAMALQMMVIHQFSVYSILADNPGMKDPNSEISKWVTDFMSIHGKNFRTFKHGAFHGVLTSLFFVLPILGINAMFERKSWTYIWLNVGFWAVCLGLMGGIICQFA